MEYFGGGGNLATSTSKLPTPRQSRPQPGLAFLLFSYESPNRQSVPSPLGWRRDATKPSWCRQWQENGAALRALIQGAHPGSCASHALGQGLSQGAPAAEKGVSASGGHCRHFRSSGYSPVLRRPYLAAGGKGRPTSCAWSVPGPHRPQASGARPETDSPSGFGVLPFFAAAGQTSSLPRVTAEWLSPASLRIPRADRRPPRRGCCACLRHEGQQCECATLPFSSRLNVCPASLGGKRRF